MADEHPIWFQTHPSGLDYLFENFVSKMRVFDETVGSCMAKEGQINKMVLARNEPVNLDSFEHDLRLLEIVISSNTNLEPEK